MLVIFTFININKMNFHAINGGKLTRCRPFVLYMPLDNLPRDNKSQNNKRNYNTHPIQQNLNTLT